MRCARRGRRANLTPFRVLASLALLAASPSRIPAGSFLLVNETFPNTVMHPANYDPTVGGEVTVGVCIDPEAAHAAALEVPLQNAIGTINALTPQSPNLFLGPNNDIPPGMFDFESLALHELGHCIGLEHPNLGVRFRVSGADTDYTQSGEGGDSVFTFDDGADGVIGSSDDLRGDDVNFHWFVPDVNNPFAAPPAPLDSVNYTRDLSALPAGHSFAANADRDVGAALGFPATEAVMQQGQGVDEQQRALQADDVSTLRFAMAGLDEIAGTPDDYTITLVYQGLTTSCDIPVRSVDTGFGSCVYGFTPTDPTGVNQDHLTILPADILPPELGAGITYNAEDFTWFFSCSAAVNTKSVTGTDTGPATYEACFSIIVGPYEATPSSAVTMTAPVIRIKNDTSIGGEFVAESAVP